MRLEYPAPCKALTMNERLHWAEYNRRRQAWEDATYLAAAQIGPPSARKMPPSVVTITIPVRGRRTRDPHNWAPTMKVAIDALVKAGVWPDDNEQWVTTREPVLRVGVGYVAIDIEPREAA